MRVSSLSFLALLSLLAVSCTQGLLLEQDYYPSLAAHYEGNPQQALAQFPQGEEGFITTLEKAHLSLLAGQPELGKLERYRDQMQDRFRFDVSEELQGFFYLETPEGYYASEPELIWMHLVLGYGYALQGTPEKSCIEARMAGHYLTSPLNPKGEYDDPLLHLHLAGLWMICGNWVEAQVDLRAAAHLDPQLDWAGSLAERPSPPAEVYLAWGGVGPWPIWEPEAQLNPLRGLRQVGFVSHSQRSEAGLVGSKQPLFRSPDSLGWYQRHAQRNHELHDLLKDGAFAVRYGAYQSENLGKKGLAGVYFAGSLAAGSMIIMLGTLSRDGNLAELAWLSGSAIIVKGARSARRLSQAAGKEAQASVNPAHFYRFARFLPEYLWLGWSEQPQGSHAFKAGNAAESPLIPVAAGQPQVYWGFAADLNPDQLPFALQYGGEQGWQRWQNDFFALWEQDGQGQVLMELSEQANIAFRLLIRLQAPYSSTNQTYQREIWEYDGFEMGINLAQDKWILKFPVPMSSDVSLTLGPATKTIMGNAEALRQLRLTSPQARMQQIHRMLTKYHQATWSSLLQAQVDFAARDCRKQNLIHYEKYSKCGAQAKEEIYQQNDFTRKILAEDAANSWF